MLEWLKQVPGEAFLVFYIVLCVVCTFICSRFVRGDSYPLPDINNVDPIRFAVLRGGWQAAVDVTAVQLIERGIIGIHNTSKAKYLFIKTATTELSELEKVIYNYLESPDGQFGFDGEKIRHQAEACLQPVYRELKEQHLLKTESAHKHGFWLSLLMILALECFAMAKLEMGLIYHKPVGFLLIIMLVGPILMWLYLRPNEKKTRLGKEYINKVTAHFNWLSDHIRQGEESSLLEYALGVAVFGVGILAVSSMLGDYRAFAQSSYYALSRDAAGGTSSWSNISGGSDSPGSDGSSSDGGGCGGGCGGCGGS